MYLIITEQEVRQFVIEGLRNAGLTIKPDKLQVAYEVHSDYGETVKEANGYKVEINPADFPPSLP